LIADYSNPSGPAGSGPTILPNATNVTLANGGNLFFTAGPAQTISQGLGSLTVNPGTSTLGGNVPTPSGGTAIATNALINLSAGTITRNQGGVLVFSSPQVTPLSTNGIAITTSNTNVGTGTTAIMGGWAIAFTQPVNAWTLSGTTVTNTQTAAAMGWAVINTTSTAIGPLAPGGYTAASNGNNGGWATANNADYTTAGNTIVAANSSVQTMRFTTVRSPVTRSPCPAARTPSVAAASSRPRSRGSTRSTSTAPGP
jgi:hypothetical protein